MTKKTGGVTKRKAAAPTAPSFEKALERLEDIVSQLESAEAPLEKALALYEEGVGLARFCSEQLKAAERRVELLEDKGGTLRGRPLADQPRENAWGAEDQEDDPEADETEDGFEDSSEEEDPAETGDDSTPDSGPAGKKDQKSLF